MNDRDLHGALDEIREHAETVRYLGRYPAVRLTDEQIEKIN